MSKLSTIKKWVGGILVATVISVIAKDVTMPAADAYIQSKGGIYPAVSGLAHNTIGLIGLKQATASFDKKIARSRLLPSQPLPYVPDSKPVGTPFGVEKSTLSLCQKMVIEDSSVDQLTAMTSCK